MFILKKLTKKKKKKNHSREVTTFDDAGETRGNSVMGGPNESKMQMLTSMGESSKAQDCSSARVKKKKTPVKKDKKKQKKSKADDAQSSKKGKCPESDNQNEEPSPGGKKNKQVSCGPFVQSTFQKGVLGLIKDFRSMKRGNDLTKMTEFVLQNPNGLNRYKDVGCLDNERVIIRTGVQPYIHANYVSSFGTNRKFICTQAPLPNTIAEFWHMIVQERTTYIIQLCNFVEMNVPKCAQYFAPQPAEMIFNDVSVITKRIGPFKFRLDTPVVVTYTDIEVRIGSGLPHICRHLHWQNWPDRGVPPADMAPIELLNHLNDEKAPIVVHCSAGIGRTGSIVLLQYALDVLLRGQTLKDLAEYLVIIRQQRNNSIQTEQQYLYVHMVLLLYLRNRRMLDPSFTSSFEKFQKEYEKNIF